MTYLNLLVQSGTSNLQHDKTRYPTQCLPQIDNSLVKSGKYENKHQSVFEGKARYVTEDTQKLTRVTVCLTKLTAMIYILVAQLKKKMLSIAFTLSYQKINVRNAYSFNYLRFNALQAMDQVICQFDYC